ncbi:hypothetical protein E6O75_ATG07793 [Venturia nashicola]|uniref:Uncharacterized protein n=1 Tax=Venturia nashicola TaxID=86259 RepID=A0A4Z1P2D6_9PEZI|nr:hypothetical protein E6O75_ATG07793 [Venturia nashicola]
MHNLRLFAQTHMYGIDGEDQETNLTANPFKNTVPTTIDRSADAKALRQMRTQPDVGSQGMVASIPESDCDLISDGKFRQLSVHKKIADLSKQLWSEDPVAPGDCDGRLFLCYERSSVPFSSTGVADADGGFTRWALVSCALAVLID